MFLLMLLAAMAMVLLPALAADCAKPTSSVPIILTLAPYMPPQIGPTSTVWGRIETAYYPVVDCGDGVSVTNVMNNPEPTVSYNHTQGGQLTYQGPFTARTVIPVLTITRVECMPTESVITRRDHPASMSAVPEIAAAFEAGTIVQKQNTKRSVGDAIAQLASSPIVPNSNQLTVQQERWITQCNTAIFCIDLINSGMSLNDTCTYLRNITNSYLLEDASIDPVQAADIICWASVYGFDLNTPTFDLISALEALEYAVQLSSNYTTNTTALCTSLDYTAAQDLGIDASGIEAFVCNGSTSTVVPSISSPITTRSSGSVTGTGFSGTAPTGSAGPYTNSTVRPTGTAISGTAAASDSLSLSFPNATYGGTGIGPGTGNLPPTPAPFQPYSAPPSPAMVTSDSSSAAMHRYF